MDLEVIQSTKRNDDGITCDLCCVRRQKHASEGESSSSSLVSTSKRMRVLSLFSSFVVVPLHGEEMDDDDARRKHKPSQVVDLMSAQTHIHTLA